MFINVFALKIFLGLRIADFFRKYEFEIAADDDSK